MRWTYIKPRLVLLGLVWLFSVFAFDPLLKWAMIKGLEKAAKARVEISSVKTTFLHPSLVINGLTVADSSQKYTNLVQFSRLELSAEGAPLLEKKFVVDKGSLTGLRFGTPRKTSGQLLFSRPEPPSPMVKKAQEQAKALAAASADNLTSRFKADYKVAPGDLESVKLAKQLEENYKKDYADIVGRVDGKAYQADLDALKARYDKAKAEKNFLKRARDYAETAKDAKKLTDRFNKDSKDAEAALAREKDGFKALDEARRRDQEAVMAKMKLPSLDSRSLGEALAGPVAAQKAATVMKWLALARRYMPASAGPTKTPARRGRVVHFPGGRAYPTLLVRELRLTGELGRQDPLAYSGTVEGLTTQPQVYGKPTVASISGAKGARRLDFKFILDGRDNIFVTDSNLSYTGMPVAGLQLGSPSSLGVDVSGGSGSFQADLRTEGDKVDGKAQVLLSGAKFLTQAGGIAAGPLGAAVDSAFSGLSSAVIQADVSGTVSDPRLAVRTNLADALSKAFSRALGAQARAAQDAARAKVDAALKPYQDRLKKLASDSQSDLESRLKSESETLKKGTGYFY